VIRKRYSFSNDFSGLVQIRCGKCLECG